MGNAIDDVTTGWHRDTGPFGVDTPIISYIIGFTGINRIFSLQSEIFRWVHICEEIKSLRVARKSQIKTFTLLIIKFKG